MKTYSPRPNDIERRWYVVDADGAVLGRLASEVASILRGKHKPIFAPHADTGDHVIVINAKGVRLTGGKEATKVAYRHSGYPGGLTATGYSRLMSERPAFVVEKAIKGMLPHNRLGRAIARKLLVYPGPEHPHAAQQPQSLKLGDVPQWTGLPEPKARPARAEEPKKSAPKGRAEASAPPAKAGGRSGTPRTRPDAAKRTTAKAAAKRTSARTSAKRTGSASPGATSGTAAKPAATEGEPRTKGRRSARSSSGEKATQTAAEPQKTPRRSRAKKEKE